jgi:hypothetical protein
VADREFFPPRTSLPIANASLFCGGQELNLDPPQTDVPFSLNA